MLLIINYIIYFHRTIWSIFTVPFGAFLPCHLEIFHRAIWRFFTVPFGDFSFGKQIFSSSNKFRILEELKESFCRPKRFCTTKKQSTVNSHVSSTLHHFSNT